MRMIAVLSVVLVCLTGCGGSEQAKIDSALESIASVEAEIERLSERLVSCKTAIRDLEMEFKQRDFHIDHVPELIRDFKVLQNEVDSLTSRVSVIGREGDQIVVRGVVVADDAGNARISVTPLGMSIADKSGQSVCEIKYDENERAMSASLRGRKENSVALYAGQDRTVIGAYEAKKDGLVGWAATVTPEGHVSAGRAQR